MEAGYRSRISTSQIKGLLAVPSILPATVHGRTNNRTSNKGRTGHEGEASIYVGCFFLVEESDEFDTNLNCNYFLDLLKLIKNPHLLVFPGVGVSRVFLVSKKLCDWFL
jgi:hypothetical protein